MFLHQRYTRTVALLALTLVLASILTPAYGQGERCFEETNQCIGGRFLQYWEQNGDLVVFGYPIASARQEPNRDTGQSHLTQWFERNRFELHTENAAPYDVLLGRLGDHRLVQTGRDWRQEGRESGPQAGCLWFDETGHNVCNQEGGRGFRQYWESHGLQDPGLNTFQRSLALFGLPLTQPRTETNSSGDTVLTQWFERARFEWHPNNPAEFKVLLGRLGDEVLRATSNGERPAGRIVYVSSPDQSTGGDLYIMNADGTGQTRLTRTNAIPLEAAEYAVSPAGDRVAYRVGTDLYVIPTAGGVPQLYASAPGDLAANEPELFAPTWAPDGSYLAYLFQDDIYARRDTNTSPVRITEGVQVSNPSCLSWASNGYLTFRSGARHTFKLWVVRSDGSDLRQIAWGLCGTLSPTGDRMAYTNGGDMEIVNLDGTNLRQLTNGRSLHPGQWSPDGTRIVTVQYNSENVDERDIVVIDAASGEVRQLTTNPGFDVMPNWSSDGRFVAFASNRTHQRYGVYVMSANGSNQRLLVTPQPSTKPQWIK